MEAGTDRSAQDWFRLMIDMGLAPGLRTLGFVGAGRRFRMEIDNHFAEITLLQSAALTSGRVRFTLHLRVLHRDEWAEQLRVRPYYPAGAARPTLQTTWESPSAPSSWSAATPSKNSGGNSKSANPSTPSPPRSSPPSATSASPPSPTTSPDTLALPADVVQWQNISFPS